MPNRVTLSDVASHAGVSRATASLVLRGTGRVSEATRERVQAAMEELGYVYNRGAAALRQQQGDTVGVVVTNPENPFFGELLTSLAGGLGELGYTCLLAYTGDDVNAQMRAVSELRERQVAGLAIVPATGTPADFVETLNSWHMPHVFMTRYVADATTHYAGADDVRGGRLAAEHLLLHGARKILYVGGREPVHSRHDRLDGARKAIDGAGLDPDVVLSDLTSETSGPGGFAAVNEFLERGATLPEAIMCHSDNVAFGAYRALRVHDLHREIPVTGYDDIAIAELWEPPLTTVSTHSHDLGQRAARILHDQLDYGPSDPRIDLSEPHLMIRESCGCRG